MSDGASRPFKLQPGLGVKDQIRAISAACKAIGKKKEFVEILEKAVHLLQTDPLGWGDPMYRSKHVDALHCQALIRPILFRYVVYEQALGVVLLSIQIYSDFGTDAPGV